MAKDKDVDLKSLSDEELMDQWTALGEEAQSVRERLTEFSQEHQRRTRLDQLRAMSLTDEDMRLLQEAGPVGVESQEEVGTDG